MNSTTDTTFEPDTSDLDLDPVPSVDPAASIATHEVEAQLAPALTGAWFARLPRYRFAAALLSGLDVLEVQCGDGTGSAILADAELGSLVCIDDHPDLIQTARARRAGDTEFKLGRGSDLEFDDDSFDAVVWLTPEWSADPSSLVEVRRVLREGGLFLGLWTNPEAYGLERVLPGAESRLLRDTSLVDACASLSEHFAAVTAVRQVPALEFRFVNVEELPVPELSDAVVLDDGLVSSEPTADFAEAIFACADDPERLDASKAPTVVALPYFGLADTLGRVVGQLYRNVDDLSQRNLVLEGQIEDQMTLALDLEEEVREQRALAADQAERLAIGGQIDVPGGATDLAIRYARCQSELAQTQQEMIDLTADFSRRVQDLTWSLQERDQYIDHLVTTVRSWELYATRTANELAARDLALTNLGEVYRKTTDELERLRAGHDADTQDVRGEVAIVRAALAQGRDPELVAATISEMRRTYDVLLAECGDLRRQLAHAVVGRVEAEQAKAAALADEVEQRAEVARLSAKVDAMRTEATEFAQEVQSTIEERNQLLREKARLQADLTEALSRVEKRKEASLDLEKEMNKRSLRIAALERQAMSQNIENTGLEKENLRLLSLKSDGDERIEALEAQVAELLAQLEVTAAAVEPVQDEADGSAAEPDAVAAVAGDETHAVATAEEESAQAPEESAEPAVETQAASDVSAQPDQDLAGLNVAALRALAKDRGMTGYSKLRKAELIARLS